MLMYSKIRNINLMIGVIFMVKFKPIGRDYKEKTYWFLTYSELMPNPTNVKLKPGQDGSTLIKLDDDNYLIVKSYPNVGGNNNIPRVMLSLDSVHDLDPNYVFNDVGINENTKACEFKGENGYLGFFRVGENKEMLCDKELSDKIHKHLLSLIKTYKSR